MATLSRSELNALLEVDRPHLVSIFMPTTLGGPETKQNVIRLRQLLDEAEELLRDSGLSGPRARDHLAEARRLLEDGAIWRDEGRGIVLFVGEDGSPRLFHVPIDLPQCAHVGDCFYVRHLLPLFAGDGRFYLLALSQNSVRLFEASRWMLEEVALPAGTPRSFAEAMRFDDPERQLQWHTGAQPIGVARLRAAVFHGQGVGTDDLQEKKRIMEYCTMVAAGVQRVLARDPQSPPLILAAAEPSASIYRQANRYQELHEEYLRGNPDELSPRELRERARSLIEPRIRAALHDEWGRYEEGRGAGYGSDDVHEILLAARNRQIQTLFIAKHEHLWGRFDTDSGECEVHEQRESGDDDLLDMITRRAFSSGAAIYVLDRHELPGDVLVAATFRYVPVV